MEIIIYSNRVFIVMPIIYQRLTERTLATGATKDDLIHIVIPSDISQDPDGSSYKITLEQLQPIFSGNTFTGGSSNCITDLYVSNIHSCSPLNINPLDEGNVYFGSTSGVTIDVINKRIGIGTSVPTTKLHVSGNTKIDGGLSADTISATTYQNLPKDVRVTGGTYSAGTILFTNNTGGTFNVTGLTTGSTSTVSGEYLPLSGGTVTGNTIFTLGLSANTISATTYSNLPTDVRVTGGTYTNGTATFTNNTGGTFNVSGFITGTTDNNQYVTGFTYNNNTFTIGDNSGTTLNATINTVTGLTVNGNLTVTGDTLLQGLTANTISATTYQNLPTDIRVTGGTYSNGSTIFTNNTGGTFNVTGFYTGSTDNDRYVTGFTYNNNTFTISDNSGNTFNSTFNVVTGLTANTISATTYQNLPTDIRTTGATYSNNSFTFTNNTGGTYSALFNTLTGVTVNGNLSVTGNTTVKGITGTTALFSGSGQSILTIIGSGSTLPLFTVQGSSGELFSINDSLVGSLFSINDISGLPILEAFSDNTILMGSYLAPSLNTTTKVNATTGTTNIYSIPTSAYTGAFFDYTVSDGTNLRAGNIMSIWSGTSINYTETSTTSLGSTTGITFNMVISGGTTAVLQTSGTTEGWTVKTIVRSI